MSWEAIASLSGVAAAVVAVVTLIVQTRQAAFVASVDLLFSTYERFFSPEMLANRRRAAIGLMGQEPSATDDVLNFFEVVGLLTRRKALDATMVWHMFSGCFVPYLAASKAYIDESRHKDATIGPNSDGWRHGCRESSGNKGLPYQGSPTPRSSIF